MTAGRFRLRLGAPDEPAKPTSSASASRHARPMPGPSAVAREWVSFPDPSEDRTWLFDVGFLLSNWRCIFGAGCQGVLNGPTTEWLQGCCSYGVHFTDEADRERVETAAATLTDEDWQHRGEARRRGGPVRRTSDGSHATRMVANACIFLNRPGFPGGAGCALHRAALRQQRKPLEMKPDVCWQLPLRREDVVSEGGHVTSTIRAWERRDWGAGGSEFHWWCTEGPEAFVGNRPVYEELRNELAAIVGPDLYALLEDYLQAHGKRPRRRELPLALKGARGDA